MTEQSDCCSVGRPDGEKIWPRDEQQQYDEASDTIQPTDYDHSSKIDKHQMLIRENGCLCTGTSKSPQINTVQQPGSDDSAPLIDLDSIQSSEREPNVDVTDLNIVTRGTNRDNGVQTSCLNIDSSSRSTSKKSQGSHAHRVPNSSSRRTSSSHFIATDSSQLSPTDRSRDDQFSPTDHNRSDFSSTEHSRTSNTVIHNAFDDQSIDDDDSKGGRMWQAAHVQASRNKDRPLSPRAKKFAETILARTRSRADPDALLGHYSNLDVPTRSMVRITTTEENGFIESTSIARKRGRVAQLLTIALIVFLIAFLGGFWVLSSCHFVSAAVKVGGNEEEFNLRFGLWKYSPIDSAFQEYSYCNNYDGDFVTNAPWFGRISSLFALAGGAFSLGVLWLYLVNGRCVQKIWTSAVFAAAISGILQLSTLSIFAGSLCINQVCKIGPAGIISIVAGCFYFVLAFEMYYNTPLVKLGDIVPGINSDELPHHLMANLEMTDFEYGAKAYWHRIAFGDANPYPSLSQVNERDQYPETTKSGNRNTNGSYMPPGTLV